jgi:hypothetical protein
MLEIASAAYIAELKTAVERVGPAITRAALLVELGAIDADGNVDLANARVSWPTRFAPLPSRSRRCGPSRGGRGCNYETATPGSKRETRQAL